MTETEIQEKTEAKIVPKKKLSIKLPKFPSIGIDADVDWRFASVGFITLLLVSLVFNSYLFIFGSKNLSEETLEPVSQFEFVDKKALKEVLDQYLERKAMFQSNKENEPEIVDPSL